MEAFVDREEKEYVLTTRSKKSRTRPGRKTEMGFWGFDGSAASSAVTVDGARLKGEDPFTGF